MPPDERAIINRAWKLCGPFQVGCNTRRALHHAPQTGTTLPALSLIGHRCNAPAGYRTPQKTALCSSTFYFNFALLKETILDTLSKLLE
jgi:hypothetical protein